MPLARAILGQLAALLIALGGLAIVLQQRVLALRLLLCGVCIAALAAIFSKSFPVPLLITAVLSALAVMAVIWGLWRPLSRFTLPAIVALLIFMAAAPVLEWLGQHWWVVPAIVFAGALAPAIVAFAVPALQAQIYRANPNSVFVRMGERLLERVFGPQWPHPKRAPHIKDFDLTRRSRRGHGPNSI